MLGRIEQARQHAATAIARACSVAADRVAIARFLRAAACRADDVLSAALPNAKADLGEQTARRSQGGHPLDRYFPCLAGGAG
jgi:hypothetical protein